MTTRHHFPSLQRGVSVITAIFIMLLMGVIAALMVNLMSTAHMTSAQDVEGSRAYQAAQAGVEWGLYQVLVDPATPAIDPALPAWPNFSGCFTPDAVTPVSLPTVIEGFSVQVYCESFPVAAPNYYTEGDRLIRVYQLRATASKGTLGMPNFMEREVVVTASKCRSPNSTPPGYECQ